MDNLNKDAEFGLIIFGLQDFAVAMLTMLLQLI